MSKVRRRDVLKAAGVDEATLRERLGLACAWLTDVAQVRSEDDPVEKTHLHRRWAGAIKGEYSVAEKRWWFFGPVWHTGQAVKALVMAHDALSDKRLLEGARLGAGFITGNTREGANEDEVLIEAYEDHPDKLNTSAILECLDGLRLLHGKAGDMGLDRLFVRAAAWIAAHAWRRSHGRFRDVYEPASGTFLRNPFGQPGGRPLLDDGIFLHAWRMSGNERFRKAFFETADRLLADEDPPGNWIGYIPCNRPPGTIHPRQAYWWGHPMFLAYEASGDRKYLECALRSCRWYAQAQRKDGGLIRGTYRDFHTDSFGHATSGTACAMAMYVTAIQTTQSDEFLDPLALGLRYCLQMQFTRPRDPNLIGAILEKVLPPDGTDSNPYRIRDLGTIFFVQAAARILCMEDDR